jgi:AmmeMemoRadiSam system protein B
MILPALRRDLEILPSPSQEQPGLLIRDSMGYSDKVIIVPWVLARCLDAFDGEHTDRDLRAALVRETGELNVTDIQNRLLAALRENAFLEDDVFETIRDARQREFAEQPNLLASHAGSAYPEDPDALHRTMRGYIDPADLSAHAATDLVGIAAPHVSPFGGWQSYRAAYRTLPANAANRTFVIVGTSHYGEMDRFGLTRKTFVTPLGAAKTNLGLVDRLASRASNGIGMEDYCFSVEHSIEFQVLFLQWLYGPGIDILPVLCGSFARSIYYGGKPEQNEGVARFLGELGEIAETEKDRLTWVLGIDMAHIGKRYGDRNPARANQGYLAEVAERDRARNERVTAGDADGFWDLVQHNRDDLRWCGSSPLYTFLKAVPGVRGIVERYEQWNIDEASVVTFAGISFTR